MNNLYTQIDGIEKPISRILYGTAAEPFMSGTDASELFDSIFALGINTIDTARVYGDSEISIGKWIEKRNNREDIVLLSKCAHPFPNGTKRVNRSEILSDINTSLKYLNTDYIDIYLLHRDDTDVEVGEIVELLNELHSDGKIRSFGGSNWTHTRISDANEYAYKHNLIPFKVTSPNFGLADQLGDPWGGDCITISGRRNMAARAWYSECNMPVIAYSSLAHGLFTGRIKSGDTYHIEDYLDGPALKGYAYPENFERLRRCEILAKEKNATVPQIAMAWIFNQPLNVLAVVSTSSPARMRQNINALNIVLTEEESAWLNLEV